MNIFCIGRQIPKLNEWVMIDHFVVKNDGCQKFKPKINGCVSRSLAALFSLLQLLIASVAKLGIAREPSIVLQIHQLKFND